MRIIAGKHKRLVLNTLEGTTTRPMMDRMKESIFNTIGPFLDGEVVLDLFAGSGALGLEALSRGASLAYFVEVDKDALEIVKKNVLKAKEVDNSQILNMDYLEALKKFKYNKQKFDIVFLDPPYKLNIINEIIDSLIKDDLLNCDALIVCQAVKKNVNTEIQGVEVYKNKLFGHSEVIIFKKWRVLRLKNKRLDTILKYQAFLIHTKN